MTLPFVFPGCETWSLTLKEGTQVQRAQDWA